MIHLPKINEILFSLVLMLACASTHAQTGEIRGRVTDQKTALGLTGVSITMSDSTGHAIGHKTYTDEYGNYILQKLTAGNYDLGFDYKWFYKKIIKGIIVSPDKATFLNVELESSEKKQKAY